VSSARWLAVRSALAAAAPARAMTWRVSVTRKTRPLQAERHWENVMHRMWIRLLVGGCVVVGAIPVAVRGQPADMEAALAQRFGFSSAAVEQVRDGQLLVKTLATQEPAEIGVLGVVRIADDKERLVRWFRDIEGFRKAAELGVARKLSSPPTINDFADLTLEAGELAALQRCRSGDCALRLGDRAIARFGAEVDWTAGDAGRRANLLARQLLLGYADAYLRGGDDALGAAHNERQPRVVAEEFRALIRSATSFHALASPLATHLERFPKSELSGAEQFLYWAKGGAGPDPSITLHHLVIHRNAAGDIYVADKQLYASRYADAGMLVLWLEAPRDGQGNYLLAGMRARSTLLTGFTARLLRGKVEEESRSYTEIYLDWIRRSLAR
jgi:hypothetical protein